MTVSPTAFTEPDQAYLAEWAKNNIPYDFRMANTNPRRAAEPKKVEGGGWGDGAYTKTETWIYECELENRARVEIRDLEARFMIFDLKANTNSTKDARVKFSTGSMKIAKMDPLQRVTLESPSIDTEEVEGGTTVTGSGEYTKVQSYPDYKDKLAGVWVKVFHQGKEVFEYKTENRATREAAWRGGLPGQQKKK